MISYQEGWFNLNTQNYLQTHITQLYNLRYKLENLNCNIKCNTFLKGTGNKNSTIITTVYDISCQYIPASLQGSWNFHFMLYILLFR